MLVLVMGNDQSRPTEFYTTDFAAIFCFKLRGWLKGLFDVGFLKLYIVYICDDLVLLLKGIIPNYQLTISLKEMTRKYDFYPIYNILSSRAFKDQPLESRMDFDELFLSFLAGK